MHGCPLASLSEASLKSFDENRLLKIHQKTQFWLYCTCGTAGRPEAGEAGVHLSPGSGNILDVTRCTATQALPVIALFSPHLWPMGLFFGNIPEEWRTKNLNPSVSPQNFLSNFQNNHSKTKGKSAFLKPTFHLCLPENHPEGKGLVCYLYSHILSSLLTWCVSQQPLKCTYLTPSLHFKAPHPWLPNTSVANLT